MFMSGWIKLHRKITENPLYFSEPFNRSMAWIDMLLIANHSDNYFFKRGIRVEVKTGQIGYDLDSLAKRWKWSRGKVERFILMLENDNQVVRQKTNVTTLISIVNYKEYQCDGKPNDKPNSKPNSKPNENKQEGKELKEVLFNDFWKIYDKQVERKKCLEKFEKLKDEEIKLIFENLPNYITNTPDKQFRKNPSTWINNKCWNDTEYSKPKTITYIPQIIHE